MCVCACACACECARVCACIIIIVTCARACVYHNYSNMRACVCMHVGLRASYI